MEQKHLEEMKKRDMIINMQKANIFAFLLMIAIAIPSVILWLLLWGRPERDGHPLAMITFALVLCLGIVVHELIHGLTWAHYVKDGWKSISFGIMWKALAPYCHCNVPMPLKPYVTGALMPLVVLGIIPWILGFCLGMGYVVAFGAVFIASAAGDIMVVWILRHEKSNCLVLDHPSEAGCIIYEEEEV